MRFVTLDLGDEPVAAVVEAAESDSDEKKKNVGAVWVSQSLTKYGWYCGCLEMSLYLEFAHAISSHSKAVKFLLSSLWTLKKMVVADCPVSTLVSTLYATSATPFVAWEKTEETEELIVVGHYRSCS